MKKDILNNYLGRLGIDSSSLQVFYTFSSGEGDVIWNNVHSTGAHFCIDGTEGTSNRKLLADRFPGLSIGYTDYPSNSGIVGSGYFTRNDMLRVGSGIGWNSWTAFLDFGNHGCATSTQVPGKVEPLISSMDGPNSISGFTMGLNNANKLFIEYNGQHTQTDGTQAYSNVTRTLDKELSKFNVVSVSYDNFLQEFSFTYHDYSNSIHESSFFSADDYSHSDVFHLAGMNNPAGIYTGYSGYIDDFLFFDKPMSVSTRERFSEAFFVDSITPRSLVKTSGYQSLPSYPEINSTGIVSTGVTGYTCAPAITVPQKIGNDIDLHQLSGVSGVVTGMTVNFVSTGSGWVTAWSEIPEQIVYNTGELLNHSKNYIVFKEAPTANDIYEFYLFKKPKTNLNKATNYVTSNNSNGLADTYTAGADISVYLNGLSQVSGESYTISSTNIFSNGSYVFSDNVSYDRIVGETLISGFESDTTTTRNFTGISGHSVTGKDIYLNGQKLVSGINHYSYTTSSTNDTVAFPSGTSEGDLYFMPQAKDITSTITGSSSEKVLTDSVDELVWLNGVKQKENEDYFRVNECSLFSPDKKVKKQGFPIYNNNEKFFNI